MSEIGEYYKGYQQGRSDERAKVIDEIKADIHNIYVGDLYCQADMCERETKGYSCEDCLAMFILKVLRNKKG